MFAIIIGFYLIFFFNNLYADSIESKESPFLSQTRQLTYTGKRSGEGYFSPKGNELIYQSEQFTGNPFYQIYRLNLINGKNQIVSNGIGKTTLLHCIAGLIPFRGEINWNIDLKFIGYVGHKIGMKEYETVNDFIIFWKNAHNKNIAKYMV